MILDDRMIALKDGRSALLRSPCEQDAEKLLAFLKKASGETEFLLRYPEEWTMTVEQERAWASRVRASQDVLCVTCFVDGEVAGNAEIAIRGGMKVAHRAVVTIAICREYWNLGIGTAMFEAMLAAAQGRGIELVELEYMEGNDRGRRLYEKFGFRAVCEKPNMYKLKDGTYRGEIHMQLDLRRGAANHTTSKKE